MAAIREEARELQLSKYKAEKRVKELESKLSSQEQWSETHLAQVSGLENKVTAVKTHCRRLEGSQSRLDKNVEEAVKLNRTLMGVNKHQQCVIDHLRQEAMSLRVQLVEARAASQQETGRSLQETQHLQQEVHHLRVQLTALEVEKISCKKDLDSCHDNWQRALVNLKTAQALVTRHQEDSVTHQAQVDSLHDQVRQLQQQVDHVTTTLHQTSEEMTSLRGLRQQEELAWTAKVVESEEQVRALREELQTTLSAHTTAQDHVAHLSGRLQDLNQQLSDAQVRLNAERTSTTIQTDISFFVTSCAATQTDRRGDVSVCTQIRPETRETLSQTNSGVAVQSADSQTEQTGRRTVLCQTFVPSVFSHAAQTSLTDHVSDVGVQTDVTADSQHSGHGDQSAPLQLTPGLSRHCQCVFSTQGPTVPVNPRAAPSHPVATPSPPASHPPIHNPQHAASHSSRTAGDLETSDVVNVPDEDANPSDAISQRACAIPTGRSRGGSRSPVTCSPTYVQTAVPMLKSTPGFTRVLAGKTRGHVRFASGWFSAGALNQGRASPLADPVVSSSTGVTHSPCHRHEDLLTSAGQSQTCRVSAGAVQSDDPKNPIPHRPVSCVDTPQPAGHPASHTHGGEEDTDDWEKQHLHTDKLGDHCEKGGTGEDCAENKIRSPDDCQTDGRGMCPELSSASDIIISPTEPDPGHVSATLKDQDPDHNNETSSDVATDKRLVDSQQGAVQSGAEVQGQSETAGPGASRAPCCSSQRSVKLAPTVVRPLLSSPCHASSPFCSTPGLLQAASSAGAATQDTSQDTSQSRPPRSKLALRSLKGFCLSSCAKETLSSAKSSSSTSSEVPCSGVTPAASSSESGRKLTSPADGCGIASSAAKQAIRKPSSLFSISPRRLTLPFSTHHNAATCTLPLSSPVHKASALSAKRSETKSRAQSKSTHSQSKYPRLQISTVSETRDLKEARDGRVSLPVVRKGILRGTQDTEGGKDKTVTFSHVTTQMNEADSDSSEDHALFSDDDETNAVSLTSTQCQKIEGLLDSQRGDVTPPEPRKRKRDR
ncbi:uncharacterized protein LOC143291168 [Babylonia areolata]|uniref:uncharacterized protein LOC143291168 n=1 Tax=Babylonia areolata TaxID=304850 RepID=UPI003FD63AF0